MDIGNMTDQSNVQFKASKRGEVVDASTSSGQGRKVKEGCNSYTISEYSYENPSSAAIEQSFRTLGSSLDERRYKKEIIVRPEEINEESVIKNERQILVNKEL